jgi:hypothetical protein
MTQATEQEAPAVRRGREGNRWINEQPQAAEVIEWFESVQIHEKLKHAEFIGGVTLIQQVEKSEVVLSFDQDGKPLIGERRDLVYVPYARVDTRVAYFWALMRENPQWLGSIKPVKAPQPVKDLPPGFFRTTTVGQHGEAHYIGCSYQVEIVDRISGLPVGIYPGGTKVVPLSTKYDIDHHALARAETGAVGRALGMAGMLVIPGSGVATAEDVQDAVSPAIQQGVGHAPAGLPVDLAAPDISPAIEDVEGLRAIVKSKLEALGSDPERLKLFQEWVKGRNLGPFEGLDGSALKILIRRLEKELDSLPKTPASTGEA